MYDLAFNIVSFYNKLCAKDIEIVNQNGSIPRLCTVGYKTFNQYFVLHLKQYFPIFNNRITVSLNALPSNFST